MKLGYTTLLQNKIAWSIKSNILMNFSLLNILMRQKDCGTSNSLCILETENRRLLIKFCPYCSWKPLIDSLWSQKQSIVLVNLNVLNSTPFDDFQSTEIVSYLMDLILFFYLKVISWREYPTGKYQISYSLSFNNRSIFNFHLVTEVKMWM